MHLYLPVLFLIVHIATTAYGFSLPMHWVCMGPNELHAFAIPYAYVPSTFAPLYACVRCPCSVYLCCMHAWCYYVCCLSMLEKTYVCEPAKPHWYVQMLVWICLFLIPLIHAYICASMYFSSINFPTIYILLCLFTIIPPLACHFSISGRYYFIDTSPVFMYTACHMLPRHDLHA